LTDRIAIHWKKPVRRRIPARIIIPASRKMTLKSIAANASSWSVTPSRIIASPPSRARIVLSIRSEAIRP
jgi:hypothetical protein